MTPVMTPFRAMPVTRTPSEPHGSPAACVRPQRCDGYRRVCVMNDARKTKAQLIEELAASRDEVTELREQVAGVDVSGVERQLAVERVRAETIAMRSTDDLLQVVLVLHQEVAELG